MIRAKVEEQIGRLTDKEWRDTCRVIDKALHKRRRNSVKTNVQMVVLICVGIADLLKKGYIQKGVA